jgi:hypothetical protein
MKVLGVIFMVLGGAVCLTIFLFPFGATMAMFGALLYIAGAISARKADAVERVEVRYVADAPFSPKLESKQGPKRVSNSMFGR